MKTQPSVFDIQHKTVLYSEVDNTDHIFRVKLDHKKQKKVINSTVKMLKLFIIIIIQKIKFYNYLKHSKIIDDEFKEEKQFIIFTTTVSYKLIAV